MERTTINSFIGLFSTILLSLFTFTASAEDKVKSPLVVTLSYFTENNEQQYLTVAAKTKTDGKFHPVKGAAITIYLGKDSSGKGLRLIGKVITNEKGRAQTLIPVALQKEWNNPANHVFTAATDKTSEFDATSTDLTIARSRITIDTTDDKNVIAVFNEYKGNAWVPVKGVDIKLGIKRFAGDLQIGDDLTYTTDSTGKVKGEFKKTGMPGDESGHIILVAKVDDNDQYGNLRIEKSIPWGTKFTADKTFFHRALWASRFHSPVWLVVIAYSIIIGVWGTLIYLVFLLIKIRKLGKQNSA